ncbi:hypothetical protein COCSADRAFT_268298 [Bipolaris sorokiniana ND90Pr]|uniref:Uncharacterized protein n=1 Tax=Cochliobolus sativus (strain ND90Pr / ATCC 201652) TaxID=665912 RepID=M2SLK7_COCSN|nr:uncharacterized protein COCSADRAFT_268298 [Bipolaris sorokiniana ND90Pr]EMD68053.1 hypothetical protein COCSADRAFT_268298 [Bipolaris sorokiniana ND90Pr]
MQPQAMPALTLTTRLCLSNSNCRHPLVFCTYFHLWQATGFSLKELVIEVYFCEPFHSEGAPALAQPRLGLTG